MQQRRAWKTGLLLIAAVTVGGCAEAPSEFTGVKQPNEPIADNEWAAFVRVVDDLPQPKLKDMSSPFPPLPQWQDARTLTVNELASEERRALEKAWEVSRVAAQLARSKKLARALEREKMTHEQFVGLALAAGAALARSHLDDDYSFEDYLRRGADEIEVLKHDQRLFSAMSIDVRHSVLDRAVWLHRIDRAERMRAIPAENVALVRKHAAWMADVMPSAFQRSPLADVADLLTERGLPFVELPESGNDDQIEWNAAEALVGP